MCGVPVTNQCGRPASCLAEGRACGFSESTPGLFCGGCPVGQMCEQGSCVSAVRPFCWSTPERIDFLSARFHGLPFAERGELWYYGWFDPAEEDPGCVRHGVVRLLDYTTAATVTFAQLDSSNFDHLDPEGCRRTGVSCDGWVSPPRVRADGLEMFMSSSYACGDWEDPELYLSTRTALERSWSRPVFIPVSRYDRGEFDPAESMVLLPDLRTLVYNANGPGNELLVARRSTTVPGDAAFERIGAIQLAESATTAGDYLTTLRPQGLSCDGRYLLYYRDFWQDPPRAERHEARRAEIISTDPLTFGPPEPVNVPIALRPNTVQMFHEAPDCGALYYGTDSGMYVQRRVPCP